MAGFNLKDPKNTIMGEEVLDAQVFKDNKELNDYTNNPIILARRAKWKRDKENARKKRINARNARRRNR